LSRVRLLAALPFRSAGAGSRTTGTDYGLGSIALDNIAASTLGNNMLSIIFEIDPNVTAVASNYASLV
jgi:hypothetical protein